MPPGKEKKLGLVASWPYIKSNRTMNTEEKRNRDRVNAQSNNQDRKWGDAEKRGTAGHMVVIRRCKSKFICIFYLENEAKSSHHCFQTTCVYNEKP